MTLYTKSRQAARILAARRHAQGLPAKIVDAGPAFKAEGCKHARYGVSLR